MKRKITVHEAYDLDQTDIAKLLMQTLQGEGYCMHEGRNKVVQLTLKGNDYVVKQYKRANWLQRIAYTLWRPSKAKRAYLYARELRIRGLNTPHEVAYVEEYRWGLFHRGWFVSEYVPYPEIYIPLNYQLNADMASAVTALVVKLHRRGVIFGDLNLHNILYEPMPEGDYKLYLVDTNRCKFYYRQLGFWQRMWNLQTLTHNRELFDYILKQYALQTKLDRKEVLSKGMLILDCFEKRNALKQNLKKWLHL